VKTAFLLLTGLVAKVRSQTCICGRCKDPLRRKKERKGLFTLKYEETEGGNKQSEQRQSRRRVKNNLLRNTKRVKRGSRMGDRKEEKPNRAAV